jgi:dTDP-4-amino-4,6-dideoxygalactose transaminase
MTMPVRFLDLRVDVDERREYLNAVDRILESGIVLNGPAVEAFESQAAAFCKVPFAVGVGSGTAALYLALRCLGIGAGDEVILPAMSFVGTANAVAAVGATPVFVDIRNDLLIDPTIIEAAISPRTKAIMPVHFTGNVCDMDAVSAIADRHALPIIEDAAPAFGASYRSRRAGTFGVLGCFSMNPMKVLGAVGEAGLVVAPTVEHAERLRELRYHGIRSKDVCLDVSLNARLDTLQAAMLSIRLKSLERSLARRQEIADRYASKLSNIVGVPKPAAVVCHAWYHYTILCDNRDALAAQLQVDGVETRIYHSRLMPQHPAHAATSASYPVGAATLDRILCLPMHTRLTDDEVDFVSDRVVRFYNA